MDRKVKSETIKEFGTHDKDTGSADVQIAVLSRRIKHLEGHLKTNKKDNHSCAISKARMLIAWSS